MSLLGVHRSHAVNAIKRMHAAHPELVVHAADVYYHDYQQYLAALQDVKVSYEVTGTVLLAQHRINLMLQSKCI